MPRYSGDNDFVVRFVHDLRCNPWSNYREQLECWHGIARDEYQTRLYTPTAVRRLRCAVNMELRRLGDAQ